MEDYIFSVQDISQQIVRYGVHVQPALNIVRDREKLQCHCNWLIERFPQAFETLLSGPQKMVVQKNFHGGGKRIQLPTFGMTPTGPVYSFPVRFLVQNVEEFEVTGREEIFLQALENFRKVFDDRKVLRVGVVHEMVFGCGNIDPVNVIASAISKDLWRQQARNIRIHLENPQDGFNVNIDIAPAYAQQLAQTPDGPRRTNVGFGIGVKTDINNQTMTDDLDQDMVAGILTYAADYVPAGLVKFLNNEPE